MSSLNTDAAYRCHECGWTGDEPDEAEHPGNEFPIVLLCPDCGTEVSEWSV